MSLLSRNTFPNSQTAKLASLTKMPMKDLINVLFSDALKFWWDITHALLLPGEMSITNLSLKERAGVTRLASFCCCATITPLLGATQTFCIANASCGATIARKFGPNFVATRRQPRRDVRFRGRRHLTNANHCATITLGRGERMKTCGPPIWA